MCRCRRAERRDGQACVRAVGLAHLEAARVGADEEEPHADAKLHKRAQHVGIQAFFYTKE